MSDLDGKIDDTFHGLAFRFCCICGRMFKQEKDVRVERNLPLCSECVEECIGV